MQQGPTKTEISPRHHIATNKLEPKHTSMICTSFGMQSLGPTKPHPHPQGFTYPLHGKQGITCHVVPLLHVVSWPCLASPTHSKIYLFPPQAIGNDVLHSTPFACGLLAIQAMASPTHSRIYPCHAKCESPTWLVVTKTG